MQEIQQGKHSLCLENRKSLRLTGVTDIDSFDEGQVLLYTQLGELLIKGKNLHISELSLEAGNVEVSGDVWTLSYGEKNRKAKASLIKKAFR
ncbi:MAG: sporulation protein YabP [Oscillospiraceae bacterium]|nr:sporulation protein YabP [Oscillospiraceae bacterium]